MTNYNIYIGFTGHGWVTDYNLASYNFEAGHAADIIYLLRPEHKIYIIMCVCVCWYSRFSRIRFDVCVLFSACREETRCVSEKKKHNKFQTCIYIRKLVRRAFLGILSVPDIDTFAKLYSGI